jgi:5-methylcytosine-specific restriction endonuclease McrA
MKNHKKRKILYFEKANTHCVYCEIQMKYVDFSEECCNLPNACTIEHIIPKSKGGTNHISNLTLACRKCNTTRSSMDIEDFKLKSRIEKLAKRNKKSRSLKKIERNIKKLNSMIKSDSQNFENWLNTLRLPKDQEMLFKFIHYG